MSVKCPVCYMQVPAVQLGIVYQGIHLSFCSKQCHQRSQSLPHLYIGSPGQKAAKQEGAGSIKQRCYVLDRPLSGAQARAVSESLSRMAGIQDVVVQGIDVTIRYDLLEATAEQIKRVLEDAGARLGSGWGERMRRASVHYSEVCEASNPTMTSPMRHRGH